MLRLRYDQLWKSSYIKFLSMKCPPTLVKVLIRHMRSSLSIILSFVKSLVTIFFHVHNQNCKNIAPFCYQNNNQILNIIFNTSVLENYIKSFNLVLLNFQFKLNSLFKLPLRNMLNIQQRSSLFYLLQLLVYVMNLLILLSQ